MKNDRLNSILMAKINIPTLRLVIENCDEMIIQEAVRKYFSAKKWRWAIRPQEEAQQVSKHDNTAPLPKRARLEDLGEEDDISSSEDESSTTSTDDDVVLGSDISDDE